MHPDDQHVLVVRPVEDAELPAPGSALLMRQRKSCASSSSVGALKAVAWTPCGSTEPMTWRTMPPLPAVSMPWTTSRTDRRAPPWTRRRAAPAGRTARPRTALSAALPASLFPVKPGVPDVSTSASTKPLPTRSALATSLISSTAASSCAAIASSSAGLLSPPSSPPPCSRSCPPSCRTSCRTSCPCPSRPCPWRHPARTASRHDGMRAHRSARRRDVRRYCPMRLLVPGRSGLPALSDLDTAALFAAYAAPQEPLGALQHGDVPRRGRDGRRRAVGLDQQRRRPRRLRGAAGPEPRRRGRCGHDPCRGLSPHCPCRSARRPAPRAGLPGRAPARRREQPRARASHAERQPGRRSAPWPARRHPHPGSPALGGTWARRRPRLRRRRARHAALVATLHERGWGQVLTEGGPQPARLVPRGRPARRALLHDQPPGRRGRAPASGRPRRDPAEPRHRGSSSRRTAPSWAAGSSAADRRPGDRTPGVSGPGRTRAAHAPSAPSRSSTPGSAAPCPSARSARGRGGVLRAPRPDRSARSRRRRRR